MKSGLRSISKRMVSALAAALVTVAAIPSSVFALGEEKTVDLYFEPTSLQPAYHNAILINGEFYSYIGEAGAQTIKIPQNKFKDGDNTVTFICGSSATGTYYDETVAPNTRNHNDPKVKNIKLTAEGTEYLPSAVTGHYITDPTIPAAQSSRTDRVDYAVNTDYIFGDGQPGGTPHPASLTIPYKIDFAFRISLSSNVAPYDTNLQANGIYSALVNVAASASTAEEDLKLYVDDTEISAKGDGSTTFCYSSNGIQANDGNHFQNGFYINGVLKDILNENISKISISNGDLRFGSENTISLTIGNSNAPYDESKKPGAVNHDDFKVSNFQLVLPDGTALVPSKVVTYRAADQQTPAADDKITSEESYIPGKDYQLGDGFPAGSDLSMFYKIDLIFEVPEENSQVHYYSMDTTKFSDGEHTITLRSSGTVRKSIPVRFDNTSPTIVPTFKDGAVLTEGTVIDAEISDVVSGVDTSSITASLNGTKISLPYRLTSEQLDSGSQLLVIHAADRMGNVADQSFAFRVDDSAPSYLSGEAVQNGDEVEFSVQTGAGTGQIKVDFYAAEPLETVFSSGVSEQLTLGTQLLKGAQKDGAQTTSSSQGLPYQLYEVDTKGRSGQVQLSCTGNTVLGETLAFQVYNHTKGCWEILDQKKSSGEALEFSVRVDTTDYVKDDKIQVALTPLLTENGSNTIAWISDTQYYTQRQELMEAKIYEKMLTWLKGEYQSGKVGYVAHTGDIVETSSSEQQFVFASGVQEILDKANVPNGIVSGNHDVGADIDNLKYSLYQKYFGASRYQGYSWYGGNYGDNTHHYDLVTVGDQDMIVLYLGMGKEALPETVAWANEVLETYSHRTAIIATHEYLNPQGSYITYARGEEIFRQIIVPNENVAMVLCGHDPGASRNIRSVPGTDRKVVEILSDYQATENGGNGFLRLLTFADGKMQNKTYSPVTGQYNCFAASTDEFTVDLPMVENKRMVTTSNFSAGMVETLESFGTETVSAGEKASVTLPVSDVDFSGWFAVLADEEGNQTQTPVMALSLDTQNGSDNNPVQPDSGSGTSVPDTDQTGEPAEEPAKTGDASGPVSLILLLSFAGIGLLVSLKEHDWPHLNKMKEKQR